MKKELVQKQEKEIELIGKMGKLKDELKVHIVDNIDLHQRLKRLENTIAEYENEKAKGLGKEKDQEIERLKQEMHKSDIMLNDKSDEIAALKGELEVSLKKLQLSEDVVSQQR